MLLLKTVVPNNYVFINHPTLYVFLFCIRIYLIQKGGAQLSVPPLLLPNHYLSEILSPHHEQIQYFSFNSMLTQILISLDICYLNNTTKLLTVVNLISYFRFN